MIVPATSARFLDGQQLSCCPACQMIGECGKCMSFRQHHAAGMLTDVRLTLLYCRLCEAGGQLAG